MLLSAFGKLLPMHLRRVARGLLPDAVQAVSPYRSPAHDDTVTV